MELFDVVFYTPEHKKEAYTLLRTMSVEQARDRSVHGTTPPHRLVRLRWHVALPEVEKGNRKKAVDCRAVVAAYHGAGAIDFSNPHDQLELKEIKPGLVVGNFQDGLFERPEFVTEIAKSKARLENTRQQVADLKDHDEIAESKTLAYIIDQQARAMALMFGVKEKKLDGELIKDIVQRLFLRAQNGDPSAAVLLHTWQGMNDLPPEVTPDEILDDVELRAGMALSQTKDIWSGRVWSESNGAISNKVAQLRAGSI